MHFYSKARKIIHNEKLKEVKNLLSKIDDLWICKVCCKTSPKFDNLRRHAETHVQGLSYQCKYCTKICPTQHKLWHHIRQNHRELSADKSEYNNDVGQVSEGELIPSHLNREINEKIQDMIVKKNQNTWKCRKCLRTSTLKSNLLSHLETHLNYSHHCPLCSSTTRTRKSLREHFRVTHKK